MRKLLLVGALMLWSTGSQAEGSSIDAAEGCTTWARDFKGGEFPDAFVRYIRFRTCMTKAGFSLSAVCDPNKEVYKPTCWTHGEGK